MSAWKDKLANQTAALAGRLKTRLQPLLDRLRPVAGPVGRFLARWVWPLMVVRLPARKWRRPSTRRDDVLENSAARSVIIHALIIFGPFILLRWGCILPYLLPPGGGENVVQKKVQVKVQKKKKIKYIVNPLSPIYFTTPKIEDIDMKIDQDTTHAYKPGQLGAGKAKGKGPGYGGPGGGKVRFIRLQYRGGDWDQDMGINSDMNLLLEFFKRTGIPVWNHTESIPISFLNKFPKNQKPPFVYITGGGGIDLTKTEQEALRNYLIKDGGMLFADNGGGSFDSSFKRLIHRVLPEYDLVVIPHDDEIFQTPYELLDGAPPLWHHSGNEVLGVWHRGRWIVFYHQGDLGDAWKTGHSGTTKEAAELAYQTGINVIHYAITRYMQHIGTLQRE